MWYIFHLPCIWKLIFKLICIYHNFIIQSKIAPIVYWVYFFLFLVQFGIDLLNIFVIPLYMHKYLGYYLLPYFQVPIVSIIWPYLELYSLQYVFLGVVQKAGNNSGIESYNYENYDLITFPTWIWLSWIQFRVILISECKYHGTQKNPPHVLSSKCKLSRSKYPLFTLDTA